MYKTKLHHHGAKNILETRIAKNKIRTPKINEKDFSLFISID